MEDKNSEAVIAPGLSAQIKRLSSLGELIHDVAMMRYFQKKFFREHDDPKAKREYMDQARVYEKKVDNHIDLLWPGPKQTNQPNLFQNENR